jgi:hypothetical protein
MKAVASIALTILGCSAFANVLDYKFNSGNEGWREADFDSGALSLAIVGASNWDSAGYLTAVDFSPWSFQVSPDLAGGYQANTKFSVDLAMDTNDGNSYPLVILRSTANEVLYQLETPIADGQLHTYSYNFGVGNNWFYGDGINSRLAIASDFSRILGDLFQVGINVDWESGQDATIVDNVKIVPEPATMIGLSLGMAALMRRKRKA